MFKHILRSFLGLFFVLLLAQQVFAAAGDVSIRLSQPKTPTNQNNLNITFVTLDTQDRAITVKCFKKGPSDGVFAQFGADINLAVGGNTGNCDANSSVINNAGTYQFYTTATAGSDTATSSTVSIDYNNSGPGAPINFSKDKNTACTYKIKFKTADDSGKTVKVRLYRADATASDPTSTSEVAAVNISSNTDGEFTDTIPDCNKTYYYAVRAFDSAGNASGATGDSINIAGTATTTSGTSSASGEAGTGGAIPVGAGQGQILGSETQKTGGSKQDATKSADKKGEVEGAKTNATVTPAAKTSEGFLNSKQTLLGTGVVIVLLATAYALYRKFKKA